MRGLSDDMVTLDARAYLSSFVSSLLPRNPSLAIGLSVHCRRVHCRRVHRNLNGIRRSFRGGTYGNGWFNTANQRTQRERRQPGILHSLFPLESNCHNRPNRAASCPRGRSSRWPSDTLRLEITLGFRRRRRLGSLDTKILRDRQTHATSNDRVIATIPAWIEESVVSCQYARRKLHIIHSVIA